ncbi:AAA domain-containing protein, partial [Coprinopsis sp. MPI-PUGE-AT-0042]
MTRAMRSTCWVGCIRTTMTVPSEIAEALLVKGDLETPSELVDQLATAPNAESTRDGSLEVPGQVVLILCGLIASGKSTFAHSLQTHLPSFRRCNQDDLGDRRSVENLVRQTLSQGLSVCVDRTNFNPVQRSYWINIAREFPGTSVWIIVFDTPYEVCAERLQHRTDHPTITSPEQGLSVLSRFAKDFEAPQPYEGYSRILHLKPEDHPSVEYSQDDIANILGRLKDSEPVIQTAPPANANRYPTPSNRGGYNNNYRGRGGYQPNQFRGRGGGWG